MKHFEVVCTLEQNRGDCIRRFHEIRFDGKTVGKVWLDVVLGEDGEELRGIGDVLCDRIFINWEYYTKDNIEFVSSLEIATLMALKIEYKHLVYTPMTIECKKFCECIGDDADKYDVDSIYNDAYII